MSPSRLHLSAAALGLLLAAGDARAFHDGGVGSCDGCHSMHGASASAPITVGLPAGQTGTYLLRGVDQSSVCLNCHQQSGDVGPNGFHVSTAIPDMPPGSPPRQLGPAGDFGWLRKSYAWVDGGGVSRTSVGERHGHNIVASDYGYVSDRKNLAAPGGTYPSMALGCTSCHDPHGKYRRLADGTVFNSGLPISGSGSTADAGLPVAGVTAVGVYRLLGGVGYLPKSIGGNQSFSSPPPVAVAPSDHNREEGATQTRVAYGKGMSEWCANCHGVMLQSSRVVGHASLDHPSGSDARLSSSAISNYVAYVSWANLSNVDATRSYWSLVPFEEGTADYGALRAHARSDDGFLDGPSASASVSCLSCHRAHASGFDGMTRYRTSNAFINVGDPLSGAAWPDPTANPDEAQGRTAAETQQSYYGRPATTWAPGQPALCNKCHVKN